ncbi:2-isopropylmalate synthase [Sesbania bispinosa]|nr:2-isopropylmalate synthase [Sesbania bispinosa]
MGRFGWVLGLTTRYMHSLFTQIKQKTRHKHYIIHRSTNNKAQALYKSIAAYTYQQTNSLLTNPQLAYTDQQIKSIALSINLQAQICSWVRQPATTQICKPDGEAAAEGGNKAGGEALRRRQTHDAKADKDVEAVALGDLCHCGRGAVAVADAKETHADGGGHSLGRGGRRLLLLCLLIRHKRY